MNSIGEISKHGGLGGSAVNLQDFLKFWIHISFFATDHFKKKGEKIFRLLKHFIFINTTEY